MLFGEYHFTGVLEDDAILPPFKGSTFRGVFGRALKEVVCALKRQECPTCLLRGQCLYTRVFDLSSGFPAKDSPLPPHPFVLEPSLDTRTHLSQGEELVFTLLLFGSANQFLPYFVYAIREMGQIGLGRGRQGRRARFGLASVSSPTAGMLYRQQDSSVLPGKPRVLSLEDWESSPPSLAQLTLSLITPLRLKFQNRLQGELPFHVVVRAVLRRLAALYGHYGGGEPPWDYQGLVNRARAVQTVRSSLQWLDWERYSHRQEQAMLLGGLVGRVTYQGHLGEFLPFLRLAEKVHLGKNTTFGLGMFKVSPLEGAG